MQLVEKHIIQRTDPSYAIIDAACFASKNLYNAALYEIRQAFIQHGEYLNYSVMDKRMQNHEAYKALPAKVAQQVLILLKRNWKSFFEANAAYREDPSRFRRRPQLPKYKHKTEGRNVLGYTMQAVSRGKRTLQRRIIQPSGLPIQVKTQQDPSRITQVHIIPKPGFFVVEVIYEQEPQPTAVDSHLIAGIDPGLNNVVALTSNKLGFVPGYQNQILRRTAMLRSQTVNTIHDLNAQGKAVQEIAQELDISRTTVRKYLKHPEAVIPKPRPPRPSTLDPFKEQIKQWVMEDHCTNCEVLFVRLQKLGYTGRISILKEYVQPLRPTVAGHAPVQRYEIKPGEQVQFDWGEFVYEHEGTTHKFYGFVAILGYSRMRFVTFVKRCDTPTLIRCLMEAFEYFGGLTKVALTDRMKSVLLKKGAYKQLNLTHLEAALSQVLEAAQREQWTYETFLQRALASDGGAATEGHCPTTQGCTHSQQKVCPMGKSAWRRGADNGPFGSALAPR